MRGAAQQVAHSTLRRIEALVSHVVSNEWLLGRLARVKALYVTENMDCCDVTHVKTIRDPQRLVQRPSVPVKGQTPAGQCSPYHQSRSDGSYVQRQGDHRCLALVNMHFTPLYLKKHIPSRPVLKTVKHDAC
jgi:hypothetical protein